jgi:hypothetical protein
MSVVSFNQTFRHGRCAVKSIFAVLLTVLFAVPVFAMENGKPANDPEAAYQAARPEKPSDSNATAELAQSWEKFADSKELKDHATITGLKGQVSGQPNCATCIAWAWNNAAFAWHLVALEAAGKKDRAGYASNLKKAVAAYEKCLACEHMEQKTRELATSHKADIEKDLARLNK